MVSKDFEDVLNKLFTEECAPVEKTQLGTLENIKVCLDRYITARRWEENNKHLTVKTKINDVYYLNNTIYIIKTEPEVDVNGDTYVLADRYIIYSNQIEYYPLYNLYFTTIADCRKLNMTIEDAKKLEDIYVSSRSNIQEAVKLQREEISNFINTYL